MNDIEDDSIKHLDELYKKFRTSRDKVAKTNMSIMSIKSDHWKHIRQIYNILSFHSDSDNLLLEMIDLQRQLITELRAKMWRFENKYG